MKFTTIFILTAGLAASAPTERPRSIFPFAKRIEKTSNCGLDMYQTLTETRLAEIIRDLSSTCGGYGDDFCKTSTIAGTPGAGGRVIACRGHTGVFLAVDPVDGTPYNVPFTAGDIAEQLKSTHLDCYGDEPDYWGEDDDYQRAFQFWGNGYNLLVTGNVDCKAAGF